MSNPGIFLKMFKERLLVKASKLCRVFIGIIFLIAGLSKMAEPFAFAAQISTITRSLIGDGFNAFIPTLLAFILPTLEVVLGVSLLIDLKPKITGRVAAGFLIVFVGITFWLWYNYSRPFDFHPSSFILPPLEDCGCFGRLLRRSPKEALFEDAIMLCFVFLGFSGTKDEKREDRFKWKGYMITGVGIETLAINGVQLLR